MSAYRQDRALRLTFELGDDRPTFAPAQRALRRALVVGFLVGVGLCGGVVAATSSARDFAILASFLALVSALVLYRLVRPTMPRDLLGPEEWALRRARTLTADESGLEVRDGLNHSRVAWAHVAAWRESEDGFFLYLSRHSYHHVPHRAFADPEEATRLRQLLTEYVGPEGDAEVAPGWRALLGPLYAALAGVFALAGLAELLLRLVALV